MERSAGKHFSLGRLYRLYYLKVLKFIVLESLQDFREKGLCRTSELKVSVSISSRNVIEIITKTEFLFNTLLTKTTCIYSLNMFDILNGVRPFVWNLSALPRPTSRRSISVILCHACCKAMLLKIKSAVKCRNLKNLMQR